MSLCFPSEHQYKHRLLDAALLLFFFFYLFNANKLQQRYYSIKWTKSEVDSVEWNSLKSVMILISESCSTVCKASYFPRHQKCLARVHLSALLFLLSSYILSNLWETVPFPKAFHLLNRYLPNSSRLCTQLICSDWMSSCFYYLTKVSIHFIIIFMFLHKLLFRYCLVFVRKKHCSRTFTQSHFNWRSFQALNRLSCCPV